MTEYTSNSEAIREYMSARERTALWVDAHSPNGTVPAFVPPSYPPSIVTVSDAPSYGPTDSDEESSHSLPPRMVLRYNDGRPDIPITTEYNPHNGTHSRAAPKMHSAEPRTHPTHGRSRSGSYAPPVSHVPSQVPPRHVQSLSYASQTVMEPLAMPEPPRSPESIVVLPSRQGSQNTQSTSQTSQNLHHPPQPHHTPSPSFDAPLQVPLPPSTLSQIPQQSSRFGGASRHSSHPSLHGIASPSPRRAFDPSQIPLPASSPPLSQSQSHAQHYAQPLPGAATSFAPHPPSSRVQSQLPYTYSPPAIIYAPSSKHSRSHYAPPAIVYSPSATHHAPSRHAPSMTYSRSDPLPHTAHHQRAGSGSSAYQPGQGSMRSRRPGPTIPEEEDPRVAGRYDRSVERERGRSRSRGRSVARTRTPAESVMYLEDHELPPPPRGQTPSDAFEDDDERATQASGSTYYVLPTPGQKVRLIVPNANSIYTATSTTKSGHSPQSAHSGPKKAFFQRIFSIPKLSGSSSSSDGSGKRIHRRHTIGTHMQGRMGFPPR
ncbi:hypothetical protein FOMPIDRAFT_1048172 [Fomitopsis schrenkii]|uniref:Uncharacterized protein n=1 Tax=Fomitopsis schrenkii TaxID=2126942 RepID=S8FVA7_FOMSC|nr:hypothetical protein FOMPIDRAFT_1048172 [Fomitopsis schrenkii]